MPQSHNEGVLATATYHMTRSLINPGREHEPGRRAWRAWHASLPVFASRAELDQHPHWARYIDALYDRGTLTWPIDLTTFRFFYAEPAITPKVYVTDSLPLLGRPYGSDATMVNVSVPETLQRAGDPRRRRGKSIPGRSYLDVYRLYHAPYSTAARSTIWVYMHSRPVNSTHDAAASGDATVKREDAAVLSGGVASHSRVEVFHCAEAEGQTGFWMYGTRGTGVFFDVGRTFVARNRCDLWRLTSLSVRLSIRGKGGARCLPVSSKLAWTARGGGDGVNESRAGRTYAMLHPEMCPGFWCGSHRELMHQQHINTEHAIRLLRSRGYDSLQLTHSEEHGIYKYEIVDLRQHAPVERRGPMTLPPSRACPNTHGRQAFSAGWGGGHRPCGCDVQRTQGCLRCTLPN